MPPSNSSSALRPAARSRASSAWSRGSERHDATCKPAPAQSFEARLKGLLRRTEGLEGQALFEATVDGLRHFLDAYMVFVGRLEELPDGRRIRTMASAGAEPMPADGFTYELDGTPCAEILDDDACVWPASVAQHFPLDTMLADQCIEGYVGTPLRALDGRPLGLLVALFRAPIADPELARTLLSLYGGRVANHLELQTTSRRDKENQRRLAAHTENTPLGVIYWSPSWHVVEWSGAAERIFGYSRNQAIGLHAFDLLPERDHALVGKVMQRLSPQAPLHRGDNDCLRRDGATIHCAWYNTVYTGAHDELLGYTSFVLDITESRAHKAELERKNAELIELANRLSDEAVRAEQANHAKTQFLATMSHELRTPLNAVIGFAELVQAQIYGPVGDSRYLDDVGTIAASGRNLLDQVNEVLEAARMVNDEIEIEPERTDTAALVNDVVNGVRLSAPNRPWSVQVEGLDALPPVSAEPRKLRQCLHSLLDNAAKHGGPTCCVTVAGRVEGGEVTIEVADDGPGIDPVSLDNVLIPFGRGADAYTASPGGLGLGLFIVNRLVAAMGGSFALGNRDPHGLRATIRLKAAE